MPTNLQPRCFQRLRVHARVPEEKTRQVDSIKPSLSRQDFYFSTTSGMSVRCYEITNITLFSRGRPTYHGVYVLPLHGLVLHACLS
jgi:hypothetical protein